ncbi:alpha-galactosidase [Mucilaginibacter boryungensis]|uniref:Alpha-galactosidase n=1 Tax=Mucilaginibacter boryungensis TaxID=768480 RepID=A0ABR9XG20_9SPHI|nr:alpha-galactosidase [Mucilaginibacter boryungensis]MBE9666127.1 alpha-galactosidase [Mucilaginibacter boryungensis]
MIYFALKKKVLTFSILVFLCLGAIAQGNDQAIVKTESPNGWVIKTKSSVYQLIITADGRVKPGYYGAKEQAEFLKKNAAWYEGLEEVPVRGGRASKTPVLEVVFNDNVRDADLQYVKGEIITVNGKSTLQITQKDRFYPLEVTSYIRVLPEYDVLEKWMVIKNTGKKGSIKVDNLQSGSMVLPANDYILTHLSGRDLNEFQLQHTELTPGLKTIDNKGFKSNHNPPWFQVRPKSATDSKTGPTWFGSLHYSGNWDLIFDKIFDGPVQVVGGINFWDTSWDLQPGTTLETPKLTIGYTSGGPAEASRSLTAYIRNDVLLAAHRNDLRPVIYNSWEAAYYSVNEKQQIDLAKIASEIGIETFTIDDGWFKGRTDGRSQSGLGNWEVDRNKFPNGLTPVIKQVHDLGMKFGLWVEPENVNPNSDVVQAHPDWIFQFPHREGNKFRQILNFANEEVYQHMLKTLTKLLSENDIDFIKWDQNNALTEPGWPNAPANIQKEVRIRHISNVYRLVDELRKRFPKVLFESCSSGGGRVDLGMLSRMDQTWLSDNTDPIDRLYIQYGYLNALPANTMVSWVTGTTRHQPVSLDYRFDVSMSGVLGIGNDIRKWTPTEKEVAKSKIALYKKIRPVVQQGVLYPLVSPFEHNRCALQYNAVDGKTAVLFCYNMAVYLRGSQETDRGSNILKLEGLWPDKEYLVKSAADANDKGTVYKGDFLMNIGIAWPVKNAFESLILTIDQVK